MIFTDAAGAVAPSKQRVWLRLCELHRVIDFDCHNVFCSSLGTKRMLLGIVSIPKVTADLLKYVSVYFPKNHVFSNITKF